MGAEYNVPQGSTLERLLFSSYVVHYDKRYTLQIMLRAPHLTSVVSKKRKPYKQRQMQRKVISGDEEMKFRFENFDEQHWFGNLISIEKVCY